MCEGHIPKLSPQTLSVGRAHCARSRQLLAVSWGGVSAATVSGVGPLCRPAHHGAVVINTPQDRQTERCTHQISYEIIRIQMRQRTNYDYVRGREICPASAAGDSCLAWLLSSPANYVGSSAPSSSRSQPGRLVRRRQAAQR
jgi:hypothetical protein